MQTFQYVSDLHLEFPQNRSYLLANPIVPVANILIIAGDLLVLKADGSIDEVYQPFIDQLSSDFKKVYIIPGNHEYYGGYDLSNSEEEIRMPIRENVLYLNNTTEVIYNHKFIFSTLWSYVPQNFPRYRFSDFSRCRSGGERLSIAAYNHQHQKSISFIRSEINDNPRKLKLVVFTHHLPSFSLVEPIYHGSELNAAFASMSDGLIHGSNAVAWIYGHSHSNSLPKHIGNTILYTNPLGYVYMEDTSQFHRSKIILL